MANEKDLVIRMAEAEADTVAALNTIMQKHGLPCYLYEPIVDKLHRQLIDGKTAELAQAKAAESAQTKESEGNK